MSESHPSYSTATTPPTQPEREVLLVSLIRKACAIYKEASYQGHSSHFDPTMQHGAGCPECIRAAKLRDEADAIMDQANANMSLEERSAAESGDKCE